MWLANNLELRNAINLHRFTNNRPPGKIDYQKHHAKHLYADGILIANQVVYTDWSCDVIKIFIDDFENEECEWEGRYLAIRRSGNYALMIRDYEWAGTAPSYMRGKGALLFDQERFEIMRHLINHVIEVEDIWNPEIFLPAFDELEPLKGWEACRLLQEKAPLAVLGRYPDDVKFDPACITSIKYGKKKEIIRRIQDFLFTQSDRRFPNFRHTHSDSKITAAMRTVSPEDLVPTLFIAKTVEWRPIAFCSNKMSLHIEPGFVFEFER